MPEIVADPPSPSCYCLFLGLESKNLGHLVLITSRFARVTRAGRFTKGSSGNLRGRPPGIANLRRRVPDLAARPLSAQALSNLLDRKTLICCGRLRRNYCPCRLPSTRWSVSGSIWRRSFPRRFIAGSGARIAQSARRASRRRSCAGEIIASAPTFTPQSHGPPAPRLPLPRAGERVNKERVRA
jgi:hypothetical protein